MSVKSTMNIAVIGAGWAGLAAALRLKDAGANVTVFEAAPIAGGRARGVDDVDMGRIDNGQHLLLGGYRETLKLITRLHPGVSLNQLVIRRSLHIESLEGDFRLHAPSLPAPFNTLIALLSAKGLPASDRLNALRMMVACRLSGWRAHPLETVQALLKRHKQSLRLCQRLWAPLCLAALNTPTDQSCAQLFLNVLRDSMGRRARDSDLIIPCVDLTQLWPAAAAESLNMRYRHIVRKVRASHAHVEVDGETFDACVVATPPYATTRLLFDSPHLMDEEHPQAASPEQLTPQEQSERALYRLLQNFTYRSIATLTLELETDWELPQPMMMLDEDLSRGHFGQWVFNRPLHPRQLTVVISDAADFLKHDRESFVQAIATQIREQNARHHLCQVAMPAVKHQRLIVEKRATFDATPGLPRPENKSPWPRIALAGDWTDTGYPAVLEGAVQSGQAAAAVLLRTGF